MSCTYVAVEFGLLDQLVLMVARLKVDQIDQLLSTTFQFKQPLQLFLQMFILETCMGYLVHLIMVRLLLFVLHPVVHILVIYNLVIECLV